MSVLGKFEFSIMPAQSTSIVKMEQLRDHVAAYAKEHGPEKCATLAQIHFDCGGVMRMTGRLYTGEAMEYIQRAMLQATVMQDRIDRGESDDRG